MTADPLVLLDEVERATTRLLDTTRTLDGAGLAAPSLLPGWTRGHVLAHVARNADSLVNLLTWARTGVRTPQYASDDVRDADIQTGAGRPLGEHLDDLVASAARFAEACADLPAAAWAVTVEGRGGKAVPAAGLVWGRLREVEVHHVDLDAGYGPADWSEAFTPRLLHELAVGFPAGPAIRLLAVDSERQLRLGGADDTAETVRGPGHALAAWLTGRSDGAGLTVDPEGPLPAVPAWK